MALTKLERIEKYICNYIIENKLCLNDPEEDEYGQCVSSFELTDVLKDTNISVGKLTVDDLYSLGEMFYEKEIYKDNDEENDFYGILHHIQLNFTYPIEIEIWDGF